MSTSPPLLSIVIFGRNDNFREDYLYRLNTTLAFLADNLYALNKLQSTEILFVDWGSRLPLSHVLTLTPHAAAITQFIEVSPTQTETFSPGTHLHSTRAVNVGIRRALGTFIMFTDSDSLIPQFALEALLNLLSSKNTLPLDKLYLHIKRYQIPSQIIKRRPSLQEWSRHLHFLASSLSPEPFAASASCLGGFAAAQLLHRDLWHELQGYDESLKFPWGWCDNDLALRVSQKYTLVDASAFGIYAMHLEHTPAYLSTATQKVANSMLINFSIESGNPEWGLPKAELILKKVESSSTPPSSNVSPLQNPFNEDQDLSALYSKAIQKQITDSIGNPFIFNYQIEAAAVLVFFTAHAFPINFFSFGNLDSQCITPLLHTSPGIESYFINPWNPGIASKKDLNNPSFLTLALKKASYKGFAKIVSGAPETALQRITDAPFAPEGIELAYVSHTVPSSLLPQIYSHLLPRGLIVLSAPNPPTQKSQSNASFVCDWFQSHREAPHSLLQKINASSFILPSQQTIIIPQTPSSSMDAAISHPICGYSKDVTT